MHTAREAVGVTFFMDRHDFAGGTTADDVAAAHARDLDVQERYGVHYRSYWFDYARQSAFCLIEAPSAEAAAAVHREAHGNMANEMIVADPEQVARFLGGTDDPLLAGRTAGSAFRVIMFTDVEDSTGLGQRLGDDAARAVIRMHDDIVRAALARHGGREVKHLGDGIMAAFTAATDALRAALEIQQGLERADEAGTAPPRVRIGLSAGEPVVEGEDLFGAAVQAAARLCGEASPGTVLVAGAVADLAAGKGFTFGARQDRQLRGFTEPMAACTVLAPVPS
jgi:class 3 adenylate cyclase